ncbi:MAG: Gfo/Idh/MocA family oxidoreductase [Planctomycetota bacterium]|nr:Gfo/Idh/MocA family oxidoreductase [Planctomycetota bacterium]
MSQQKSQSTRRQFIGNGTKIAAAGVAAGSLLKPKLSLARSAHAFGSDTIKIGLVGCGGRGTGAAIQAMNTTSGNVELVAMADAFENRLENALKTCTKNHKDKVRVPKENQHVGFNAYKEVMASDADMVLLATPPGFRPLHLEAAIDAGKHVFMEKPVAVDAPGVRRVLAAGEKAKEKNLAIAVGLQRRHERAYRETIDPLQNGAIGDFVLSRAYWNGGGVWVRPRTDDQSEMEYQMRNWYYFNWLCGDHIVEQHIHNLDVINWLMDGYPVTAQGQGGRLVRTGVDNGQIYDHHFIEFTYADGSKMFSQCRHIPQCYNNVSEHVHGTKGSCNISGAKIYDADGQQIFHSKAGRGGHQQEHHDLFADLRAGVIPNEAEYGAKSTMTSIFGRLATYTGKELKWEDAINSNLSLANVDEMVSMKDEPPVKPDADGKYPIPKPGKGAKESMDWG